MRGDTFVVVIGNAFDGLAVHGPFDHIDVANHWGDDNRDGDTFVVVKLEKIEEGGR